MKNDKLNLGTKTADTFTAANGQTIRYEELFQGAHDAMNYVANTTGKNHRLEDLEDTAQEVFQRIIDHLDSYNPEKGSNPHGFGSRVAENYCKDALKRVSKRSKNQTCLSCLTLTDKEGDEYESPSLARYRSDEDEPDYGLLEAEKAEFEKKRDKYLNRVLRTLPKEHREILQLIKKGYKSGQIAEKLGLGLNAAYIRISRAKAAMREALGPEFRERFHYAA